MTMQTPLREHLRNVLTELREFSQPDPLDSLRHETVCTLYELARVQREVEAEMGWPLTPTDEIVTHLKTKLFGED